MGIAILVFSDIGRALQSCRSEHTNVASSAHPLSQGWKAGDFLFTGGQISADDKGRVVGEGDIEIQTRNVFEGITTVLREGGCTWRDVVKLNAYYVFDGADDELTPYWERMTRVRMKYLADPGPAATAMRVAGLIYPGLIIEAEAIALLPTNE